MLVCFKKREDKAEFISQLKNCPTYIDNYEFWSFKKNSKIGREWIKSFKDSGIEIHERPVPMFYFGGNIYQSRSSIGFLGEALYLRFACDCDFCSPDYFQEIKASEFFKAFEKNEKEENNE